MTTHAAAPEPEPFSNRLRVGGWALHFYTATGTVLALLAVVAAMDGDTVLVLWLLLATLLIDGTDGMLARRLRVKETIPWFDGARLDDIVDYITYAFVPVVLLWTGGYLPSGVLGGVFAALPLIASSFQFCRTDAKTEDNFFLGFPSYWNVVAFYVVILGLSPVVTAALLVFFAVLVFVPLRYIYPSRTVAFHRLSVALTAGWFVAYAVVLAQFPDPHPVVVGLSLAYVVYYAALSVYLTLGGRHGADSTASAVDAPVGGQGDTDR